jgi:hypothetical protein
MGAKPLTRIIFLTGAEREYLPCIRIAPSSRRPCMLTATWAHAAGLGDRRGSSLARSRGFLQFDRFSGGGGGDDDAVMSVSARAPPSHGPGCVNLSLILSNRARRPPYLIAESNLTHRPPQLMTRPSK